MIFVSVGTQLGFDRLIKYIDAWSLVNPTVRIFAQIGAGGYCPSNFKYKRWLQPSEYDLMVQESSILVSHAGMGSIITAIDNKKSIIILPRKHILGEHRNDHQFATAEKFSNRLGIYVARNETELFSFLDNQSSLLPPDDVTAVSSQLIKKLEEFILS